MHLKDKVKLALLAYLGGSLILGNIALGQATQPSPSGESSEQTNPSLTSPALISAIAEYTNGPDTLTWEKVAKELRDFLCVQKHADLGSIVQANPSMSALGVKIIDAGGLRVWTFLKVPQADSVILQWMTVQAHSEPALQGRRQVVHTVAVAAPKAQLLKIPATASVTQAKIVFKSTVVEVPIGHGKKKKMVTTSGGRNLILAGNDKVTGMVWIQAYRAGDGSWIESPDVLSTIPPFLLQNVQGKVTFQGSDLVLNISQQRMDKPQDAATPQKRSQAGSYKIVLKLNNGHYTLEGKASDEGPMAIVNQFLTAVSQGRQNLTKAWLQDAKLANIPNYLGLYGKGVPYKVITMANPLSGGSRFRVITFGKDDLILDVGLVKKIELGKPRTFWAIKGMFVAPPDPFAQRLLGVVPQNNKPEEQEALKGEASKPSINPR